MLMEASTRSAKRLASDGEPAHTKRVQTDQNTSPTSTHGHPLATAPSAMEIRAFGLEDRAEAVISRGKESWTLANLSKWRHDTLDAADSQQTTQPNSKLSSKEFLRQRQRAYRHQVLAAANKQPDS